jgi:hypothetical protein
MATEFQPYVGPRPFERTKADQERFFGRDEEARDLLSRVTAHSAVLFYSQSGAGKTSLINAKLIPLLQKAGFEVLPTARVREVADSPRLSETANICSFNVLRSWDEGATPAQLLARMSIPEFLKNRQRAAAENGGETPRVAIFDQFEELFTSYETQPGERDEFIDQIGAALDEDRLLRVIFALREDYLAELDPYLALLPEKLRPRSRLERLSEDDALLAITQPLAGTEYSFAEGVAEQLVEDLLMVPVETPKGVVKIRGESVEPVQLQVVCQTLWENCWNSWRKLGPSARKVISREYLETFGDVDQALSAFYESAIKRTAEVGSVTEGALRRWFEQSIITSAGTRGTVFRGREDTGGIPNAAVDLLVNQHIIRGEVRGGSRWYELTHDRLIQPIKASNERWLLAHSGGEQTPKRLEARAAQWVRAGRKKADLLDEGELLEARRWLESPGAADIGYSDTLFALVQASSAASEEAAHERERSLAMERAKSAKRLVWLATALALMFLIAVAAFLEALRKQEDADAARKVAEQKTELANSQTEELRIKNAEAEQARDEADRERVRANQEQVKAQTEAGKALRQSQIAARNERRAVAALKQAGELERIKNEISSDEGNARELRSARRFKELLSVYEKLLANYTLLGDKVSRDRIQDNINELKNQIQ